MNTDKTKSFLICVHLRSSAAECLQFRSGLPLFNVKAIRSWVFFSPQSDRNASRSRSNRYCSLTSAPGVTGPPHRTYATQLATFTSLSLVNLPWRLRWGGRLGGGGSVF